MTVKNISFSKQKISDGKIMDSLYTFLEIIKRKNATTVSLNNFLLIFFNKSSCNRIITIKHIIEIIYFKLLISLKLLFHLCITCI